MFATAKELVDACKAGRVYGNYPNEKVAQEFIDKELQRALDNNQGCKGQPPVAYRRLCTETRQEAAVDWLRV